MAASTSRDDASIRDGLYQSAFTPSAPATNAPPIDIALTPRIGRSTPPAIAVLEISNPKKTVTGAWCFICPLLSLGDEVVELFDAVLIVLQIFRDDAGDLENVFARDDLGRERVHAVGLLDRISEPGPVKMAV